RLRAAALPAAATEPFPMSWIRLIAAIAAAALAAQGATAQTSSNESHSVNESTPSQPPQAEKRPHSYTFHGITVEDPYAWLRDPGYPDVDDADVIAHLNAENAWFEA